MQFALKKIVWLASVMAVLQFAGKVQAAEKGAAGNWPQFRGPRSTGVASSKPPDHWSATENIRWKSDIPGRGWSSPIVWSDRVFLTTAVNQGESETPKKGLYFGGNREKAPQSEHLWKVFCLKLQSGEVLWEKMAHQGVPAGPLHLKNSYATETPVTDGERVYVYFGNLGLFCYDFNGELLWSKPLEAKAIRFGWGTAASPVLHRDHLFIVNDNEDESYLLALDKRTGEEVWRTARDEKSNWATPFVWENEARTEIVTAGTGKIRSYDLNGQLLWELGGMSSITIATPYASGGLLYISSGYVLDRKRPIFAIRPGATGDISLGEGETSNQFIAWCSPAAGPYNPSTLVCGGRLYVLFDLGFFACHDAQNGRAIYEKQRLPDGRAFTASPWAIEDKVFCLNEDGVTFVMQGGDEFKVLHTNSLAEDDMCLATPAIAGNRLLIRSAARVYCIASPD